MSKNTDRNKVMSGLTPELEGEESLFVGGSVAGSVPTVLSLEMERNFMKTLRILVLFSMVSLWANSQSKAQTDLPSLTQGLPDLTGSSFVYVDYTYDADPGSGAFVVNGYTTDYSGDEVIRPGTDSYILSATISSGGVLAGGGTLNIYGNVGSGDNLLLSGNLTPGAAGTAFGYGDGDNQLFQFLFTVSGGSLESAFGGSGAAGGIIFNAKFDGGDTLFTGSWTSEFDSGSSEQGIINAFALPVPEPSSILLVSAGVLCMVARRRLNVPTGITSS
jgi:hypothetical protein